MFRKHRRKVEDTLEGEEDVLEETADEKRIRMAKEMVEQLKRARHDEEESSEEEGEDDPIHAALYQALRTPTYRPFAEKVQVSPTSTPQWSKRSNGCPTCLSLSENNSFCIVGDKLCRVLEYDLEAQRLVHTFPGGRKTRFHKDHVLSVACSPTQFDGGNLIASGSRDSQIRIWDRRARECIANFKGHNDAVTGLAFREGTMQLISCSKDRTVKMWKCDELAYVDTLYGHVSAVHGVDCMAAEQPITVSQDSTARSWKIERETHLIFKDPTPPQSSIECVRMLDHQSFLTGAQNGSLYCWLTSLKKPSCTVPHAHTHTHHPSTPTPTPTPTSTSTSTQPPIKALYPCMSTPVHPSKVIQKSVIDRSSESRPQTHTMGQDMCVSTEPNWLVSIATCRNTNLAASGSSDGYIRLWKIGLRCSSIEPLQPIAQPGYVNGMAIASTGRFLVAACGTDHRLGRFDFERPPNAKNTLVVHPLIPESVRLDIDDSDDDEMSHGAPTSDLHTHAASDLPREEGELESDFDALSSSEAEESSVED
eukprot:gnl/Trimastix_PCT/684.p1 GENE.gnl/Trimastix_PCT/684~~gnl/Trimastix_PCT/684.p1  ORF type:complete len:536 (-),score=99.72 gnl/Trimastix_PCT/684:115-1722(-)